MNYVDNRYRSPSISNVDVSSSFFVRILISVSSVGILFLLFIRIMNYDLRKDEELYLPPARLLDQLAMYRDFFYNHPPGSAWLFYVTDKLAGSEYLLLSGRLCIFVGWVLFAAAVAGMSYVFTRSVVVSWCVTVLTLMNNLFLAQTGMTVTNNLLPLAVSFLGLSFFLISVSDSRPRPLLAAVSGCLVSLAVVLKISAIAFIPPVAIAAFFLPLACPLKTRLSSVVAPLAAGGVIGGLPILIPLLSDPVRFLAHVVGYHTGPHLRYWQLGGAGDDDAVMSLAGKLLLAWDIWLGSAVAVVLSIVVALFLIAVRSAGSRRSWLPSETTPLLLVVVGALVCSAALSFMPTPSFPQYFAPPLICLPLLLILLFAGLDGDTQSKVRPLLIAGALVVLVTGVPRLGQYAATALHPNRWAVMQVHAAGTTIAQRIEAAGVTGKVATLFPVYPLEGGLEVYPELATGPFAYRSGDVTEPSLAALYKMTSPTKITALLENEPPAALLLGFDPVLESPMLAYAQKHGYSVVSDLGIKDRYGKPVLYLRNTPPG